MSACKSYILGNMVCRDGFVVTHPCWQGATICSCGATKAWIGGEYAPFCLRDELPKHMINEDGSPRLYKEPRP